MTPEADWSGLPDPEFQPEFYADIPLKRLVAWAIDMIFAVLLAFLLAPLTAFTALFYFPFWVGAIGFAYRWITLSRGSATWGMRLVAIELRGRDGHRLDAMSAGAHTLIYSVAISTVILQVASILLMLTSPRRQGLPDLIIGTAAINRTARF